MALIVLVAVALVGLLVGSMVAIFLAPFLHLRLGGLSKKALLCKSAKIRAQKVFVTAPPPDLA